MATEQQMTFTAEWFGGEFFTAEWFPYKVERFERSDKVALMKLAEEGAYHRAIRIVWKDQTMPADPQVFAAKIQKGCSVKVAEAVLKTFLPVPGNPLRVYHPVVEEIRFEQWQKRLNRIKGGKASRNGSILNGANKDGSSITEQCLSNTPLDLDLKEEFKEKELRVGAAVAAEHEAEPECKPVDVRKSHPTIVSVQSVANRYPPKEIWDELIEQIGVDVDIGRLRKCFAAWVGRGFNRTNYDWALDWYVNDRIPTAGNKQNGTNRANSNGNKQTPAEIIASRPYRTGNPD